MATKSFYRLGAWGLADQGLISAASLLTLVLLTRSVSADAFGLFVLAYAALLFLTDLQAALVTQPHNVLGAARLERGAYIRYTAATGVWQGLFLLVALALALAAALGAGLSGWSLGPLLWALVPAIAARQAHEFFRRVLYTEGRVRAAFLGDLVGYGGQALALAALSLLGLLSGTTALYALAGAAAVGAAVQASQLPGRFRLTVRREPLRENWEFGRWLAGGAVAYWCAANLYFYLAAAIVSPSASGALKAAQIPLGPLTVVLAFLAITLPIRFSRLFATSRPAVSSEIRRLLLFTAPPVAGYCALVALFAGPLLTVLYDDKYAGHRSLVVLMAAYYFVLYVFTFLIAIVNARGLTRYAFFGNVAAALLTAALGWPLTASLGARGAALGMILSLVVAIAVTSTAFGRAARRREGGSLPEMATFPRQA